MKDKENIKNINKLSISYMMLSGLNGKSLDIDNPFLKYLAYNMIMNKIENESNESNGIEDILKDNMDKVIYTIDTVNGLQSTSSIIPNELVHMMIEESYIMYKKLDEKIFDKKMTEEISNYLNKDSNTFIDDIINNYNESFMFILMNYNSNRESYNLLKINVYENELNKSVKIEDYDSAIFFRDKIKSIHERIKQNKIEQLRIEMEQNKKDTEI